jgi:hypothetical protein
MAKDFHQNNTKLSSWDNHTVSAESLNTVSPRNSQDFSEGIKHKSKNTVKINYNLVCDLEKLQDV